MGAEEGGVSDDLKELSSCQWSPLEYSSQRRLSRCIYVQADADCILGETINLPQDPKFPLRACLPVVLLKQGKLYYRSFHCSSQRARSLAGNSDSEF